MLDAHAREQEHIAATAMRTVSTRNGGTRQVPDWPRRAEAARRAASLREQISLATRAANAIDSSVADLENVIITTNHQFRNMRNTAQSIDFRFASAVHAIEDDIYAYNKDMEYLYESFSEDGFDQNFRFDFLGIDKLFEYAIKAIGVFGESVLDLLKRGVSVGQALTTGVFSRPIWSQFGGIHLAAHREGMARLISVLPSTWQKIGNAARMIGQAATPINIALSAADHFNENRDFRNAFSYGIFVGGGSGTVYTITKVVVTAMGVAKVGKIAIKLWPITLGVVAWYGLNWAYRNFPVVKEAVHGIGNGFSSINWTSSDPVLESEFWTPEILSFYGASVGNAAPANDWTACIWENRCGN